MEFAGDNFGGDGRRGVEDGKDCNVCAAKEKHSKSNGREVRMAQEETGRKKRENSTLRPYPRRR